MPVVIARIMLGLAGIFFMTFLGHAPTASYSRQQPPVRADWEISRAATIARIVWHQPCVDRMQIRWASAHTALASGETGALAVAWADQADCIVYLSTDQRMSWPQVCTRVLHEAGHLAGYRDPANIADPDHSLNPRSIMYARETSAFGRVYVHGRWVQSGGDARCANGGRPFLAKHREAMPVAGGPTGAA